MAQIIKSEDFVDSFVGVTDEKEEKKLSSPKIKLYIVNQNKGVDHP